MPEFFSRYYQKVVEFWNKLDKSQKNRIYITAAILIAAVILGLFLVTKKDYVAVVSSNDSKEINEMRKILSEKGINHKLSADRTSILVYEQDKNKAELALAVAGYPKDGMTFEDAWNQIKINTTESDKKKLWEEYKKKSLVAKIKMFSNVKDADVDLALPEPNIFQQDQKPTAFVRITPKEKLTPEQVKGIVMVVARSVENLDPKDVTVVDDYFNILNSEIDNELVDKSNTQAQAHAQKELELEKKVYNLLGGPSDNYDTIKVVANPVLDFNTQKTHSQTIEKPNGMEDGYIISRQQISENLQNGTKGGEPGLGSNGGSSTSQLYQMANGENSSYTKKDITENFDYSRTTIDQEKAVGVMVPEKSTLAVTLWYGRKVTDESKLSQDFIDKIVADVSKATGIPVSNISVNKYKLAPAEVQKESLSEKAKNFVDSYGVYLLLLVLIIGLIIALFPRKRHVEEPEAQLAGTAAVGIPPEAAIKAYAAEKEREPLPEIVLEEKSEFKKQIDRFVKQKPDAVAQLLRNWLSEDWD